MSDSASLFLVLPAPPTVCCWYPQVTGSLVPVFLWIPWWWSHGKTCKCNASVSIQAKWTSTDSCFCLSRSWSLVSARIWPQCPFEEIASSYLLSCRLTTCKCDEIQIVLSGFPVSLLSRSIIGFPHLFYSFASFQYSGRCSRVAQPRSSVELQVWASL